jgi:hypothetical protein
MRTDQMLRIARRNPFYLLSALFMLLGCFALSHHLSPATTEWQPLVVLIGVLQVYEILLLAMAVHLNRSAHDDVRGEGRTLFALGLVFLVDATYLNAELAASHPVAAPWVASGLLLLGMGKLVVFRNASGRKSRRAFLLAVAELALVFYVPGIVSAASLSDHARAFGLGPTSVPRVAYALWWLVGALPVAYLWVERDPRTAEEPASPLARAILWLPFASILLHFFALHWLYAIPFRAAYVSPLLVGVSTYATVAFARELGRHRSLLRLGAAGLALLFAQSGVELWTIRLASAGLDWVVSPFRITLIGLALAWLVHFLLDGEKRLAWTAAAFGFLAVSGATPRAAFENWASAAPTTAFELGVASIVTAFALLALGFARSLAPSRGDPSAPARCDR